MVVTMTVAGLAEVAIGSALAGGIIGGVGVKVHDMLKASDYIVMNQHVIGGKATQIQKITTIDATVNDARGKG